MSRIGHQTARDLESCNHCGHARMDHMLMRAMGKKRTYRQRGHCTMDCGCPKFQRWKNQLVTDERNPAS